MPQPAPNALCLGACDTPSDHASPHAKSLVKERLKRDIGVEQEEHLRGLRTRAGFARAGGLRARVGFARAGEASRSRVGVARAGEASRGWASRAR